LFVAASSVTNAQGVLDKAKSVGGASGFDVLEMSEGIMGKPKGVFTAVQYAKCQV
jgi:hypothetical protein